MVEERRRKRERDGGLRKTARRLLQKHVTNKEKKGPSGYSMTVMTC